MRNYLTIAGKDSRDFGVYISGQGTFSAPEKAYQFYDVPGRSGALIGNDQRLENIEVTYQCFIYSNFSKNIADFRTFLLSLNGYQKLTDTYHPDEYRMAVYVGPFEPEVTAMNDAGSFELVFNCKPQRWLESGKTQYSWVPGGAQDLKGNEITAFVHRLDSFMKSKVQAVVGITEYHAYINGVEILKLPATGTWSNPYDGLQNTGVTSVNVDFIAGQWSIGGYSRLYNPDFTMTKITSLGVSIFKITSDTATDIAEFYGGTGGRIDRFWVAGELGTRVKYYTKRTPGATEADTIQDLMSNNFAFSIYNDYIYIHDVDLEDITASDFTDYWGRKCLVFYNTLSTPTHSFTPVDFSSIGTDWATFTITASAPAVGTAPSFFQTDWLTMKYTEADAMVNPTLFPSEPLIRTYGTGAFTMDGVTVTISSCSSYVDIDCELMDCYEGSTNRNNDVSFSTYDFPKLRPGENEITIVSGITSVEITPRWWRV